MEREEVSGLDTKSKQRLMNVEEGRAMNKPKTLKAKHIARKIKSFDHFIYIWGEKAGYYLPPKSHITWHYISQVLSREKRLLRLGEVGHIIDIPKVKGALVNEMFGDIKDFNELHSYFPDFTESHNIPREYFFNVRIKRYLKLSIQNILIGIWFSYESKLVLK